MALSKAAVQAKRQRMDLDAKILASQVKISSEREKLANLKEVRRDLVSNQKSR